MDRHPLAKVWSLLQGQTDIDCILREILGQFTHLFHTSPTLTSDSTLNQASQLVSWIKAIFDLQRTYLQSSNALSDLHSIIIDPYLVSATVFSVISLSSELYILPTNGPNVRAVGTQAACTILSGIRLLLLQQPLHLGVVDEIRIILSELRKVWKDPESPTLEATIITYCEWSISNDEEGRIYIPACGDVELPKFTTGLFLDLDEAFLQPLSVQIHQEDTTISPRLFWNIFDILWALEAAKVWSSKNDSGSAITRQSGCTITAEASSRANALRSLFHKGSQSSTQSKPALSCIMITLFETREPEILELLQYYGGDSMDSNSFPTHDQALVEFGNFLLSRKSYMQRCNSDLTRLSSDFRSLLQNWLEKSLASSADDLRSLDGILTPTYIVQCPNLHPVPGKWLEGKVLDEKEDSLVTLMPGTRCPRCPTEGDISRARRIEPITSIQSLLQKGYHGQDNHRIPVPSARSFRDLAKTLPHTDQIESDADDELYESPRNINSRSLSHIRTPNGSLGDLKIHGDLPTNSKTLPSAPLDEKTPREPIIPSKLSTHPARDSRLSLHSWFGHRGSSGSNTSIPLSDASNESRPEISPRLGNREDTSLNLAHAAFSFSSSGDNLIIWHKDGGYIAQLYDLHTDPVPGRKFHIEGIQLAGAGKNKIVVLRKDFVDLHKYYLGVVNVSECMYAECEVPVNGYAKNAMCIVVSGDDRYAAISCGNQVLQFSLSSPNPSYIGRLLVEDDLHNMVEQTLSISVDGCHITIATQASEPICGKHNTVVHRWHLNHSEADRAPVPTRTSLQIPQGSQDRGLTSALHDPSTQRTLLTTFSDTPPRLIFKTQITTLKSQFGGEKIQAATQSSTNTSRIVLLTRTNKLWEVKLGEGGFARKIDAFRGKKAVTSFRRSFAKIGIPREELVHVVWEEGGELVVGTVQRADAARGKWERTEPKQVWSSVQRLETTDLMQGTVQ
ncbi:uncharacterized protein BDR25DRAFT_79968 [Lindgomyces ingoldianus]|uniref:Uncharacterized protein n=1 Tax=Lindgomyces ingoldianus TaxID=673940 RepID=A0ACB6QI29_9PLEO|nr:uncharacterized protein BDR25DRAFT_79968 [Lindgomyces ingoldianus]KAF2466165.1 hypothetical protein BDR25DRAFT_79968 [Lindgomyces ingoldianus]